MKLFDYVNAGRFQNEIAPTLALVSLLATLTSCSSSPYLAPQEGADARRPPSLHQHNPSSPNYTEKFALLASLQSERIWSPHLSPVARRATRDYTRRKKIGASLIYGDSVRKYDLRNKCAATIEADLTQLGCKKQMSVLKNVYKNNEPVRLTNGKTVPLVAYLCPDGGAVRLKPEGDPTSKFMTQPIVSKALRYPYDSKFDNFDDEVLKVDNLGNAIPKWQKDLNPEISHPSEQKDWIKGWALGAHTDLKLDGC
jgi:hypothetical protein